jgi:tagatose-6-phosphate ketose/aldose isomerase
MKYLGIDSDELTKMGGIHTAIEICHQPDLWQKVWEQISLDRPSIMQFLNKALTDSNRIILTGAGTSAFIGLSLRGVFQQNTGIITEAIATTDIVSHPNDYFLEKVPTLMISFARSGNSPESAAAIDMADEICETCYHLIITCNEAGNLAGYGSMSNKFVITLPKESNDVSLAMTSSYTGMLLTGLLVARIEKPESTQRSVEAIIKYAQRFIFRYIDDLRGIAKINFSRAVFLGAGSFYGTATESNLKLQEFTDGKVICKNDSYLGFRHGPKSVINDKTLVVYILSSSNEYAFKYEKDLINSMKKGTPPMLEMSISESALQDFNLSFMFHFSENGKKLDDEFLALCYILPAQILGFYKSIELGLQPDTPSSNNDITRVVEGVQIYSMA